MNANRTAGIRDLIDEVLKTLSRPYSEDVTDDVFSAIEHNASWRTRYEGLVRQMDRNTVNTWLANWVREISGRNSQSPQVPARSGLIESYSKLPV
jgi:hypothetical protein